MKRKIIAIFMIIAFSIVFLTLPGCTNQFDQNINDDEENMYSGERSSIISPTFVKTIEELEDIFIFSRVMEILGFMVDTSDSDPQGILINNISDVKSYYLPSENFLEGFELANIIIYRGAIRYRYLPIGITVSDLASITEGITISLSRPHMVADFANPLDPLVEQWGIPLTEDGLLFEVTNLGYNEMVTQVGNTRMNVRIPSHLAISSYESMRDMAFTEFTEENIMCVEEMIMMRDSREIVVTFPGMDSVTLSYSFDSEEWIDVGIFDGYASFAVPSGTSHVKATKGSMEHTFILPADDNFITVLYVPVSTLSLTGVSVMDGDVVIAQNDNAVSVPVPVNILFPVIGEEGIYWAILIARAGGNYPVVVTVTDIEMDFAEYFYDVVVPVGVTNLKLWSNETFIVDVGEVSGGDTVTLMKTEQAAGMEFSIGGVTHTVHFTLDGSDPFAGFR